MQGEEETSKINNCIKIQSWVRMYQQKFKFENMLRMKMFNDNDLQNK